MRTIATLMLILMASSTLADPHACDAFYKPLPTKDLDQVFGEWRLIWGAGEVLPISDVKTSAVALHLDGDIIRLLERNLYNDNSCITYSLNVRKPASGGSGDESLVLQAVVDRVVHNGTLVPLDATFTLHFYERSPNAMLMYVEAGNLGRFLLSYARQGHAAEDAEKEKLNKMVECLAFRDWRLFVDDGVTGFCHTEAPAA
ncbi:saxitoxin and tetrodotoxin-binding protein 1-like [Corythoichthys intestinalis]|uniref:saxitoxin and tetrodotoxin-binding protein 1-like n=1 Tax=Corythoichthys intestinalis TaxID=161448 RepID=UPI0025A62524|nr:saxitoxin and tetrodotoxin-binding protein 1-like [Corythoichthys intestinalis]